MVITLTILLIYSLKIVILSSLGYEKMHAKMFQIENIITLIFHHQTLSNNKDSSFSSRNDLISHILHKNISKSIGSFQYGVRRSSKSKLYNDQE